MIGAKTVETIKLRGDIKGRTVHMLVDSGSTRSFINTKTLQKVGLVATEINHGLRVEVANGQHMISRLCCQDARSWLSPDYDLASDLFALYMCPTDVVLGCNWMKCLGEFSMVLNAALHTRVDQWYCMV